MTQRSFGTSLEYAPGRRASHCWRGSGAGSDGQVGVGSGGSSSGYIQLDGERVNTSCRSTSTATASNHVYLHLRPMAAD